MAQRFLKAQKSRDPLIKRASVEQSWDQPTVKAIPDLIKMLGSEDRAISSEAVRTLAKLEEALIEQLTEAVRDKTPQRRSNAIVVLGKIKANEGVTVIVRALNDPEAIVRRSAARALGRLKLKKTIPVLIEALTDDDIIVQRNASRSLKIIDLNETLKLLSDSLKDSNPFIRRTASRGLVNLHSPQALSILETALRDSDTLVRRYSFEGLIDGMGKNAVSVLIGVLGDDNEDFKSNAIRELQLIGAAEVSRKLEAILSGDEQNLRRSTVKALRDIAQSFEGFNIHPFLNKALHDEDEWVRYYAVKSIAVHDKDRQTANLVLSALRDGSELVRVAGVEIAVLLQAQEASGLLTWGLRDRSVAVRLSSAEALGKLKVEQAIDALIETVEDEDGFEDESVREKAIWSLGQIGGSKAVKTLIRALGDENRNIRQTVIGVLENIGEEFIGSLKQAALRSNNIAIRKAAAEISRNIILKQRRR